MRGWVLGIARVRPLVIFPLVMLAGVPLAMAEHEADHRFTVEGYVCGADGAGASNVEIMVKDTRVSIGKSAYTDTDGYFSVTLHLHNDNQGDPILVRAGDQEQHIKATFDPKDIKTERKAVVTFGSGCESKRGSVRMVYIGLGLGLAGVAAVAGRKLMRKQHRVGKRGKGQRKSRE